MNLQRERKIKPDFSMASMTDLVFLLLIFFMLVSTLINTNALDLLLPGSTGGKPGDQPVSVSITKKGKYYINRDEVTWGDFNVSLMKVLSDRADRSVAIHAEQGVVIEKVVDLLDVLNQNDIKAVLAVDPK